MSALPPATVQRVASLKPAPSISAPIVTPNAARSTSSSRVTTQTMSSMQKQSDASLRGRTQLPTIAGSPSVGANNPQASKPVTRDIHSSSLLNSVGSLPKDTPTKIPRISSRTSAISTPPPPKNSSFLGRRASVNTAGTEPSPTPGSIPMDEFGVVENGDNQAPKSAPSLAGQLQNTTRSSPSTVTRTRQTAAISSTSGSFLHRKSNRESSSFAGLRKGSSGSVASIVSVPSTDSHRFSALSPSKGLKLLSPKVNLSSSRIANSLVSKHVHQAIGSPSSSRQSLSTPSPGPNSIDEEELLGDEEMMHYIRRQQAKKMATGATQEELDELLRFPEPLGPGRPSSPACEYFPLYPSSF
jgi:dual specificity tyrosine-phosphorylation-regulated kinase 2/3/4